MPLTAATLSAEMQTLLRLQQQGQYGALAEALLQLLTGLHDGSYVTLTQEERKLFELLAKLVLKLFSDPAFLIPNALALPYINLTVLISNLVSLTSLSNTDLVLKLLVEARAPISKLLPLYSYRNGLELDIEALFQRYPHLVYAWWTIVLVEGHYGVLSEAVYEKQRQLLRLKALSSRSDFLTLDAAPYQAAFYVSYLDGAQERYVKSSIHKAIAAAVPTIPAPTHSNMKKLLVVTGLFYPRHAVYKCLQPQIAALKGAYETVLIDPAGTNLGNDAVFDRTVHVPKGPFSALVERIRQEKAGIILYPEIGMDVQVMALANMRLAPIQVTMYGHPVSSYCPTIDYYLASSEGEALADIQANYAERVLLLPGMAATGFPRPTYARQHPPRPDRQGRVIVSCAWGGLKIQYPAMRLLKQIAERSRVPVLFRFPDMRSQSFSYIPFVRDIEALLGKEQVECFPPLSHGEYMRTIEEADLALDSLPFGGYNRSIDTLHCGKPILTLEGSKFYTRMTAMLLRWAGLDALIADSEEAFVTMALKLIEDADYRQEMTARVQALDLQRGVVDDGSMCYFKSAIDYLVAHDREMRDDRSHTPVIIGDDAS